MINTPYRAPRRRDPYVCYPVFRVSFTSPTRYYSTLIGVDVLTLEWRCHNDNIVMAIYFAPRSGTGESFDSLCRIFPSYFRARFFFFVLLERVILSGRKYNDRIFISRTEFHVCTTSYCRCFILWVGKSRSMRWEI